AIGPLWTVVTLALLGTFYAATDGVLPALVSPLVPASARGTGIAAAQTVQVLARFGSSVAFGGLWVASGPRNGLLVVAGLLAGALPLAAWLLRPADRAARGALAGRDAAAAPDTAAAPDAPAAS